MRFSYTCTSGAYSWRIFELRLLVGAWLACFGVLGFVPLEVNPETAVFDSRILSCTRM